MQLLMDTRNGDQWSAPADYVRLLNISLRCFLIFNHEIFHAAIN